MRNAAFMPWGRMEVPEPEQFAIGGYCYRIGDIVINPMGPFGFSHQTEINTDADRSFVGNIVSFNLDGNVHKLQAVGTYNSTIAAVADLEFDWNKRECRWTVLHGTTDLWTDSLPLGQFSEIIQYMDGGPGSETLTNP